MSSVVSSDESVISNVGTTGKQAAALLFGIAVRSYDTKGCSVGGT